MSSMPRRFALLASTLATLALAGEAAALEDCPPGSSSRSENGFTWCEPSVCANDGQCRPDEVCRPVALCMQVGKVDGTGPAMAKDASAQRLVVTQRCGPNKTCPDTTVCSDLGRCLAKTTADKMGLLAAPATSGSAAPASGDAPKAKSCGCTTPGAPVSGGAGALASVLGLALVVRARTRRPGADRAGSTAPAPRARRRA